MLLSMTFSRRKLMQAATVVALPLSGETAPLRLLVVTGGHSFDKSFFEIFRTHKDKKWEHREHEPKSTSTVYSQPIADSFDVVLLYDMPQKITAEEKQNFLALFDKGVGVVALHHSLCSYQDWDTFGDIIGARMRAIDDGALPAFTYKHDVRFLLQRVDGTHPVLEGVSSFTVFDETYGRMFLDSGSQPLLVTGQEGSIPVVAWARKYKQSRVVAIQPGHGPSIFQEAQWLRLLSNAVRWAADQKST